MNQLDYVYLAYGFAFFSFTLFGVKLYARYKKTQQKLNHLES